MRSLWSTTLAGTPRGLLLAREKGWLLAWDDRHWLYLFNRSGDKQGQLRMTGDLAAACIADDGSALAAVGARGEVWWLAPDLTTRWDTSMPGPAVTAALDPFGQYLAVSDARGSLHVFDRLGRLRTKVDCPRPLRHLAFVPAAPYLVGSADFGLVACFDLAGSWVWRDGLVAHVGSLTVDAEGEHVVLACFSEGLRRYSVTQRGLGRLPLHEPCRLAAQTFDGQRILAADLSNRLLLCDGDGRSLATHELDEPAVAVALTALGEAAAVALAGGRVMWLSL